MQRSVLSILMAMLAAPTPGAAQVQNRQAPPVDQAVGDLDPLATSFRRVDPGLAQFDRATALRPLATDGWQRVGGLAVDPLTGLPMPEGYVYTAPGFRAYLPQAEYVVRSQYDHSLLDRNTAPVNDGEFLHATPANIVYDLIYRPDRRGPTPANPAAVDRRLDTRLDARLPAHPAGRATGNADYLGGVTHRSPQQALVDFYRGDNRAVVREGTTGQEALRVPPRAASRAQQHVVDEADAPQPRRDERDDAAGE